jgi:hypothetical protein
MIACLFTASDRVPMILISSPEICKISLPTSGISVLILYVSRKTWNSLMIEEDCDLPEILISFSGLGFNFIF